MKALDPDEPTATDGGTLRSWQEAAPRTREQLLAAYVAAARGLAAAHDAGLVHRDFKPDHVLRTTDGHIRVADLGLDPAPAPAPAPTPRAVSTPAWLSDDEPQVVSVADWVPFPERLEAVAQAGPALTATDYLAPEQHRGDRAGPAADQFAFCVSLWEALTGERPFPAAPASGRVPAWLVAVLTRGMANDPAQRWPSMHALIAALLDDPIAPTP